MLWAVEEPARYRAEQAALEKLAAESEWLKSLKWAINGDGLFQLDAEIVVGQESYAVELVYPKLFPSTPAFVRPRHGITERWSTHQYGPGGVLCLEWGPDTWRPEVTGADLLRSTHKLLSAERPVDGGRVEVPSRHRLTVGQEARGTVRRVVFDPSIADFVSKRSDGSGCKITTRRMYHDGSVSFFIAGAVVEESVPFKNGQVPVGLWESGPLFCWEGGGWMFKCAAFSREAIKTTADLLGALKTAGIDFAFPKNDEKAGADQLVMVCGPVLRAFTVPASGDGAASECMVLDSGSIDSLARLPVAAAGLHSKRIGIVGLGSVGSKIAVSLARSGIKRFLLVDDDLMLPGNVFRSELDWTSVGAGKVEAVKEALSVIASDLDVQCRRTRIAGQESAESASTAMDALAACDIIIDATASPAVFVLAAAIAKRRNIPMVWGELFAGAIGAFFARSRPGKDADPLTMRAALHVHLEKLPKAPFRNVADYDVTARQAPMIAYDFEVAQLAAIMSRLAIDTLANAAQSEFPNSAYLQGFKREWIFAGPFDTYPLDLGAGEEQAVKPDPEEQAKVICEIIELAEKKDVATNPAS